MRSAEDRLVAVGGCRGVITEDGLIRFWLGTVLLLCCSTPALWVARSYLDGSVPWLMALGVGAGSVALCVLLLVNRSADGPYIGDLVVAAGLLCAGLFVLSTVTAAAAKAGAGNFWLFVVGSVELLGFALVFSLGDYPD